MPWKEILRTSVFFGLVLGVANIIVFWSFWIAAYVEGVGLPLLAVVFGAYLVLLILPFVRIHYEADRFRVVSGLITFVLSTMFGCGSAIFIMMVLRKL